MYCIHEYLRTSDTDGEYLMLCCGMRKVAFTLNWLPERSRVFTGTLSARMNVGLNIVDTVAEYIRKKVRGVVEIGLRVFQTTYNFLRQSWP